MPSSPLPVEAMTGPLFTGLSRDVKRDLARQGTLHDVPPGTLLARAGESSTHLELIIKGRVRLFVPPEDITLDFVGPSQILGECALCGDPRHPASAETVTETTVLRLSPDDIWNAILSEDAAVFGLLSSITIRLKGLLSQVNDMKLRTTTERLAMFLVTLARENHPDTSGPVDLTLPHGKRQLAARLGMTAESLSRSLGRLAAQGVGNTSRTAMRIENVDALAEFAGLHALDEDPR
ncbi:MAG: Crp/Fnr family transcriptional regulator [Rhodospirillum sp.]|nr:Crp/Fnr family transcriptional regulator [Rhodospirillum sp.]MCF8488376.1 Crp/Fnr family transcriptional regulator [Rhodospirillum sp.]MCF8500614.1 Crp/Fnr family transcriptional regulator [Rhodospirillum sp.]